MALPLAHIIAKNLSCFLKINKEVSREAIGKADTIVEQKNSFITSTVRNLMQDAEEMIQAMNFRYLNPSRI